MGGAAAMEGEVEVEVEVVGEEGPLGVGRDWLSLSYLI